MHAGVFETVLIRVEEGGQPTAQKVMIRNRTQRQRFLESRHGELDGGPNRALDGIVSNRDFGGQPAGVGLKPRKNRVTLLKKGVVHRESEAWRSR